VQLRIYDPSGRLVRTLAEGDMEAGERNVVWDGRDERGHAVPSGVYFCLLSAGEESRRLKLTFVR
jgi:flagellar hook assembly protein FlgD